MKTLGQTLRASREKRGVSVPTLAEKTSVHASIISALEDDNYAQLPALPLVQGYVQLLAHELNISAETAVALLRRDAPREGQTARNTTPRARGSFLRTLRPPTWRTIILSVLFVTGLVWLLTQWQRLGQPPKLEVRTPQPYSRVSSPVEVTGQTNPNAALTLNTQSVSLDEAGNFNTALSLPPGERALVFTSIDNQGRQSEVVIFVTVE